MCLAQGPQRSDAGEARTRGPSISSQALYHWATALPTLQFVNISWQKSHGANHAHTLTKMISEDVGFDNYNRTHEECSPFITLYLSSKAIDCVISEPWYKGTILLRNYRKITTSWSFSNNSFVNCHGKKNIEVCYKETTLYKVWIGWSYKT